MKEKFKLAGNDYKCYTMCSVTDALTPLSISNLIDNQLFGNLVRIML